MADRQELLDLYAGLRVADVRDGMDWCMMHNQGSMWPRIRPLYRTHAIGIARTARYLPFGPYLGIGIGLALLAWKNVIELLYGA